jgi:hypothetical protein
MFPRRLSRVIRRMGRQNVLAMLQHANQLLVSGSYAEAARAFEQLAHGAEERFSERAPYLYLQAGRAAIWDGQTQPGVDHLRRGLTLLGSQGRFPRMQILGHRIMAELNERGLKNEATEIAGVLNANLPRHIEAEQAAPAKKPVLPTHCPSCGGALRPDEVEWLDEATAECAYCGSPVRGE